MRTRPPLPICDSLYATNNRISPHSSQPAPSPATMLRLPALAGRSRRPAAALRRLPRRALSSSSGRDDFRSWQAAENVDIQRVTQTAMVHDLTQQQTRSIEAVVPWFLETMPDPYFRQVYAAPRRATSCAPSRVASRRHPPPSAPAPPNARTPHRRCPRASGWITSGRSARSRTRTWTCT